MLLIMGIMPIHKDAVMILCFILFMELWLNTDSSYHSVNDAHHSRRTKWSSSIFCSSSSRYVNKKESSPSSSFLHRSKNMINSKTIPPPTAERTVVIMYHKPPNIVTSHSEKSSTVVNNTTTQIRKTVYDDIMSMQGYIPSTKMNHGVMKKGITSFSHTTNIYSKLHAIGRLDADTSGLLLLTNDGLLVHAVTNPNAHISFPENARDVSKRSTTRFESLFMKPSSTLNSMLSFEKLSKTYLVRVMGYHTHPMDNYSVPNSTSNTILNNTTSSSGISKLLNGIVIPSEVEPLRPISEISILSHDPMYYRYSTQQENKNNSITSSKGTRIGTCTWLHITLFQGKNRQIRNMFHTIGSGVLFLHRISVGNIHLSDPTTQVVRKEDENSVVEYALQPGQWRILTEDEVWKGLGYPSRTLPI